MSTPDLNNGIERFSHSAAHDISIKDTIEAPAMALEGTCDVFSGRSGISHSRISTRLHRFWEALALFSGTFLVVHGILGLIRADSASVWYFLSAFEACIGLVTVIVDSWFLTHV